MRMGGAVIVLLELLVVDLRKTQALASLLPADRVPVTFAKKPLDHPCHTKPALVVAARMLRTYVKAL